MYRHKYQLIIPFLFPALALYLIFVVYPYGRSMYLAFHQWNGIGSMTFVGLDNFKKMIGDANFWNALGNTLTYLAFIPVTTIALSLFFAFLLTQRVRFSNFYRITFFFPQVMLVVAIGVLWRAIYHPTRGFLTPLLHLLQLEPLFHWLGFDSIPAVLGDPSTALLSVGAVVIWQGVGFFMVLFIAAMQNIPVDYYEAAAIDGAKRGTMFWQITLPLLRETLRTATIFSILQTFTNIFPLTMVITEGERGPNFATEVLETFLYDRFIASQHGYATAIAVVLFLMILTISVVSMQVSQRQTLEY